MFNIAKGSRAKPKDLDKIPDYQYSASEGKTEQEEYEEIKKFVSGGNFKL